MASPSSGLYSGLYDNDEDEKFDVQVEVTNRTWGRLFGYRGSFDVTWEQVGRDEIPNDVKPEAIGCLIEKRADPIGKLRLASE